MLIAALLFGLFVSKPPVAVVSFQAVMMQTKVGKAADAKLQSEFAPDRKKLFDAEAALVKLNQEALKAKGRKQEKLKKQVQEDNAALQRNTRMANDRYNQEKSRIYQEIVQKVIVFIRDYSKSNGYHVVIDISSPNTPVLFSDDTVDITKDVIAAYDASQKQ